jgi:phosphohistidine phosphatase
VEETMDVYLVRHGSAEPRGGKPDGERALTPEGAEKTAQVARGLKRLDCRPGAVVSSPLRRAQETAHVLREVLCPDLKVDVLKALSPGASAGDLAGWLSGMDEHTVVLVGHNPDMPCIVSELISGDAGIAIEFKKAAVCLISFDGRPAAGEGTLRWLLQPGQLRAIGRGG